MLKHNSRFWFDFFFILLIFLQHLGWTIVSVRIIKSILFCLRWVVPFDKNRCNILQFTVRIIVSIQQFYIAMISAHAMFLSVNQFAQCIKHEWKQCSFFSPPATVILLLFLTFEALLFAVFTLIMLGSQMNAIWNDETVCLYIHSISNSPNQIDGNKWHCFNRVSNNWKKKRRAGRKNRAGKVFNQYLVDSLWHGSHHSRNPPSNRNSIEIFIQCECVCVCMCACIIVAASHAINKLI